MDETSGMTAADPFSAHQQMDSTVDGGELRYWDDEETASDNYWSYLLKRQYDTPHIMRSNSEGTAYSQRRTAGRTALDNKYKGVQAKFVQTMRSLFDGGSRYGDIEAGNFKLLEQAETSGRATTGGLTYSEGLTKVDVGFWAKRSHNMRSIFGGVSSYNGAIFAIAVRDQPRMMMQDPHPPSPALTPRGQVEERNPPSPASGDQVEERNDLARRDQVAQGDQGAQGDQTEGNIDANFYKVVSGVCAFSAAAGIAIMDSRHATPLPIVVATGTGFIATLVSMCIRSRCPKGGRIVGILGIAVGTIGALGCFAKVLPMKVALGVFVPLAIIALVAISFLCCD